MPVQNIYAAIWTDLDTESDPGQIVRGQKILTMTSDVAGTVALHYIGQHLMLVDVTHEKLIAKIRRKGIGEVKSSSTVGREMGVIPNRRDVVIHVRIQVSLALLVVVTALHDVKEVGNDAAGSKALADVIEIKAPRIRQPPGIHFELLLRRMIPPDSAVDEKTVFICHARLSDHGRGEDTVASIEPAIGPPDKTVQRLVSVVNTPSIQ